MSYKARIIHSPLNQKYILQAKEHWWTRWEDVDNDSYRGNDQLPSSYYPLLTQTELLQKFQNKAETLVSKELVYSCKRKYL